MTSENALDPGSLIIWLGSQRPNFNPHKTGTVLPHFQIRAVNHT